MENKLKVWLTRENSGILYGWQNKPHKYSSGWLGGGNWVSLGFNPKLFPQISWEDAEPTEAYITLIEPQEQPAKEIDWEQRRYEIAKDILKSLVADLVVESAVEDKEMLSKYAINIADTLINKLKKESE